MTSAIAPTFRFSGHETFPCRYAWLPKAVRHLSRDPLLFQDEEKAMVALGVGKNMVRSIKFWAEAADVICDVPAKGFSITPFGLDILGREGYDTYLEKIQTLWLLHWKISTNSKQPLFAWHFLLNHWHRREFSKTEILQAFTAEVTRLGKKLSAVTLDNDFTTFVHTYTPTRSKKNEVLEDNLDCPLVELDLLLKVGEKSVTDAVRRESVYAFRVEEKPEISPALFVFCLEDFWRKRRADELTLTFRDVSVAEGSPGQIFKLPESDIRHRLECIKKDSKGAFDFRESSALQQVIREKSPKQDVLLENIYDKEF